MSGPFATYFGNQRIVVIPVAPTKCTTGQINAGSTVVIDLITLSAANIAAGTINAFVYYAYLWPNPTAAASALACTWQWQFRTAAHANVGGATQAIRMTTGWNAANAAGIGTLPHFAPCWPSVQTLTIPATAAEIVLQRASAIIGAPVIDVAEGWGIDITNTGTPGDIGGGGIVAQGANNPNAF